METKNINIIKETFEEIASIVTPTMGGRGQLAILQDEFSRPILTDDGVTVAKQCMNYSDTFKKMVAMSMVEAASNTEKLAFDGTTLTILLTNELYLQGLKWIKKGMHPQIAADKINTLTKQVVENLKKKSFPLNEKSIDKLATLTTKIPMIGYLVAKAHETAGNEMDIIIEHDRKETENQIEYVNGMIINDGYFSETLKSCCNEGDKAVYKNARLVLLAEDALTPIDVRRFFESIPAEAYNQPFIFIVSKGFNPESMKLIMDVLVQNKMTFMFIFLNDSRPEEIFLDIAAKTNGKIQSSILDTTAYRYEYCGVADEITIEQDKTTIIAEGNPNDIKLRLDSYNKELEDNKYTTGYVRLNTLTRRKANLNAGVTKIKLACQSVTEYMTIRLKLDDAIGAVKCAIQNGLVIGGGKTLWKIGEEIPELKDVLQKPLKTILQNAGYKLPKKDILKSERVGINVQTGLPVDYINEGIIDSYDSVEKAIMNASSIASQYLRTYILIKKD